MAKEIQMSSVMSQHITGFFCPFRPNGEPFLMTFAGHTSHWVLVFSSRTKMEECLADVGQKDYVVRVIGDGRAFAEKVIGHGLRVALDPFVLRGENQTRWTEILLEEDSDTWRKDHD